MDKQCDIGLIGLAVMGQNLVLNMSDHGFGVAVYNRTWARTEEFLAGAASGHPNVKGFKDLKELVASIRKPRVVMLMVKAGSAVDDTVNELLPFLQEGDIIVDGGNSHFPDTERRVKDLAAKGIRFVGSGVSGGEEGARHGPSLMPGGDPGAWERIRPIFEGIAAKTSDGGICCDWMGSGGAGHFVKMVHNGIEYGDMQLITEAWSLLDKVGGLDTEQSARVFENWNKGQLESYLIEITAEILKFKDSDGSPLVGKILDAAGQKGTGKWTVTASMDFGIPLSLIGEAVFARTLSALKDERTAAAKVFGKANPPARPRPVGDEKAFADSLGRALLVAKIISYAQGFMLLRQASRENNWKLAYSAIAAVWRGGCIIRSAFLGRITEAYERNPELANLLLDSYFTARINEGIADLRVMVSEAALRGIPLPALSAALTWFDGWRSEKLPASLLQAQRDYFGAHQYERTDKPRGSFYHTDWTGTGGAAAAGTYSA